MITPECIAEVGFWVWAPTQNKPPIDEAAHRTAASRLYYSAYHRAKKFADANSLTLNVPAKGSHDELMKRLTAGGHSLLVRKLRSMKALRCHADYELGLLFEEVQLKEMSNRLTDVISLLP